MTTDAGSPECQATSGVDLSKHKSETLGEAASGRGLNDLFSIGPRHLTARPA